MYSARMLNLLSDAQAVPREMSVREKVPARECTLAGIGGLLTNRDGDFDLQGRDAWVFISIKNRSFSRQYIDRLIDLCDTFDLKGHICVVDDPYRYNAMAEHKCDTLPVAEAEKLERLSQDFQRMIKKAINGKCTKNIDIVQWSDLEAGTPATYRAELNKAFYDRTIIRDTLFDHVTSMKPIATEKDFERYAEFFLCEVPVLFHAYYSNGPTLDIYPGPQPHFFWQVETGVFKKELPELTALAQGGRAMLYLDTHDRSGYKS